MIPRPHHQSAPIVDVLPCDIAVEICGGLTDIYCDTNEPAWHRIRLCPEQALQLYRALADKSACSGRL